mmetsp:Transcript_37958/g.113396  ORF Transcript_37958/g.113396 Transcript_37958/m.113396 type:complete len:128 (-) Transcript_37958:161-544(-)
MISKSSRSLSNLSRDLAIQLALTDAALVRCCRNTQQANQVKVSNTEDLLATLRLAAEVSSSSVKKLPTLGCAHRYVQQNRKERLVRQRSKSALRYAIDICSSVKQRSLPDSNEKLKHAKMHAYLSKK